MRTVVKYVRLFGVICVLASFLINTKSVRAQSCICSPGGDDYVVSSNNCGNNAEPKCDPSGLTSSCTCIAKETQVANQQQEMFCPGDGANSGNPKINTALGCIPVDTSKFIEWLLPPLFGIVGGISFLLMISGFLKIATSQGDPKAVQAAQETITSAITGLLFAIFSLFLLRLIAVNILHIPGIN